MAQIGLLEDNARIAKLCTTFLHFAGHDVTIYEHPKKCLHALLRDYASGSTGWLERWGGPRTQTSLR